MNKYLVKNEITTELFSTEIQWRIKAKKCTLHLLSHDWSQYRSVGACVRCVIPTDKCDSLYTTDYK